MTARYPYVPNMRPPAPFVHVALHAPVGAAEIANLPAQVDTGADRTVLPWTVVESLGLIQLDVIQVGGFGGVQQTAPTFAVLIGIRLFPTVLVEVVASKAEEWVLLGRDVLNHYRLVLDGPNLSLQVD